MARPSHFSFSVEKGDPVALATAFRDIIAALEPLSNDEARDVLHELGKMYGAPTVAGDLLDTLAGIVANHDKDGRVDESWWESGRSLVAHARGR